MVVHLSPSEVKGSIPAPPSKSISHRAILCAGLCRGNSELIGLGKSQDIEATLRAVEQLCASVSQTKHGINIFGRGGFRTITRPVNCNESGSTLRFLIPLFSLTQQKIHFTGGGRLFDRPQKVYADLFASQGLEFEQTPDGIEIFGALRAGNYTLPGNVSSQFISGLLFTLPLLERESTLTITGKFESASYVDITRAVLYDFGIKTHQTAPNQFKIPGNQRYIPCQYHIEGDYSNAAFLAVLGAICGDIRISSLRENSTQGDAVILDILANCGARFSRNGDCVSFVQSRLHGTVIDLADCPDLGPILMVLALFCEGSTTIINAGRLRLKESDRILAMETELKKFGVQICSSDDTIVITPSPLRTPNMPLCAHNDHRIVMSLAILALAAKIDARFADAQAVAKSWPEFFLVLHALGADITVE